ncbi:MAG: MBL fold metallo-hydrolase, partial [Spirochaetota bacterium]
NVRRLGYAPTDIKKILLSHAHIDHIGGARTLKELTGAEIYLGRRDILFVTERKDLIGNEDGEHTCGDFEPDQLYEDGGQVRLGEIAITTVASPGHTPGCTSFFFDVKEKGGRILRCGMHGGVGLNTMSSGYFRTSSLPATLRDEFAEGLARFDRMEVDVCMPSHPNQVEILSLVDKITEGFNPYVNPQAWHTFLQTRLAKLHALIEEESTQA